MRIHVEETPKKLIAVFADWIINYIGKVLMHQEIFTWAISGGNSPKQLYELLAQSPASDKILWKQLHIFFGDERYVSFDDIRNNGKMAYDALLSKVPIPPDQIHYMRTDIKLEDSVAAYKKILHDYFDTEKNSFDLVLLGMGDNGHTLSIFPESPLVAEKAKWVSGCYVEEQQMERITLTAPIVNKASQIAFLVTGENKAAMVKKVIEGAFTPDQYPAQLIKPDTGELHWFLDLAAASESDRSKIM
ncbi:MAG: 6-phosphogluconolactonase [Chitinophagales bacterium]|nr:6-phosphogluconolactonase [Chitinophagales bacterium]